MTLDKGYTATSTAAYTITGDAPVTVSKTSGDSHITWNSTTRRLDIAAGLAAGDYAVTLTATNSVGSASLTFTLTVNEPVYSITIGTFTGGVVTTTKVPSQATAGETVTLQITPNTGYELEAITAVSTGNQTVTVPLNGTGLTRTFTMPAHNVTVTATFRNTGVGNEGIGQPQGLPLRAWSQNGTLHVTGLKTGEQWSVYNLSGVLIYRSIATDDKVNIALPNRGLYIIQSGNRTLKIIH
jgi:hypothetical protein